MVDREAKNGKPELVFTRQSVKMQQSNNFSFSGIKTAVINYVHCQKQKGESLSIPNVCASFQTAVVEELVAKTMRCLKEYSGNKLVVAGGVAANSFLKKRLIDECKKKEIELFMPALDLCTDNAAMIGSAAFYHLKKCENLAGLGLTAKPTIALLTDK